MKILFVSGNLCDGGAQRVIAVVASALAERGHAVNVILYSRNESEYPISEKVKISSLGDSFQEYSSIPTLKRIRMLRNLIRMICPDAAVGFLEGGYGLYVSSFGLQFPKVASARIQPQVILNKKGLRGYINRFWFSHADAVVLQNSEQEKQAPRNKWKNCVVIPNPVSRQIIATEPVIHESVKRIVMVGRLSAQKNYPMMIRAMREIHGKYPDIFLDIYGKGALKNELTDQIHSHGLDGVVSLRGWTEDAAGEYKNSDLYVLSSDYEGMPNALLEAMAVGIPCISTDCETGPKEMIDDGKNGFLTPVNDEIHMVSTIEWVIGLTADERRSIGLAAKEKVKELFSDQIVSVKWEQLFKSLIQRG